MNNHAKKECPITNEALYEKYKDEIISLFKENYEGTLDMCGPDDELTAEAKELFDRVSTLPINECKDDITYFFQEAYDLVGGDIEYYYSGDKRLIKLFKDLEFPTYEVIKGGR